MKKIKEKIMVIREKLADKLSAWITKYFELDDLDCDEYIENFK